MKVLPVLKNVNYTREGVDFPSFINETLKKTYITNELLNGNDVDTVFNEIEDLGTLFTTANQISVILNLKNLPSIYSSMSLDDLKNTNYLILKNSNEYVFYFVDEVNVKNTNQVKFFATLDYMSSYINPSSFDSEKASHIRRCFSDRITNITDTEWNYGDGSPLHLDESIFDKVGETVVKNTLDYPYKWLGEYRRDSDGAVITLSDADKLTLDKRLSKFRWMVMYQSAAKDTGALIDTSDKLTVYAGEEDVDSGFNYVLPYHAIIAPDETVEFRNSFPFDLNEQLIVPSNMRALYSEYIQSDAQDLTFSNIMNINLIKGTPFTGVEKNETTAGSEIMAIGAENDDYANGKIIIWSYVAGSNENEIGAFQENVDSTRVMVMREKRSAEQISYAIDKVDIKPNIDNIGKDNLKDYKNEPKLYVEPISKYTLAHTSSDPYEISPDLLYKDEFQIQREISFTPEYQKEHFYVKAGIYNKPLQKQYGLLLANTQGLPRIENAWKEWVLNYQASAASGVALAAAKGSAQVLAGASTGSPLGLSSGIISGASTVADEIVRRKDKKLRPNKTLTSNNPTFEYTLDGSNVRLFFEQIQEQELKSLSDYFHKYAYILNRLLSVADVVNTRYYFDYVECLDVRNNIKSYVLGKLTNEAREQINNKFNEGVRLWHYRDASTFKGVGNYKYDNTEMTIEGGV